jgi:excisionase family DNA binding protein
MEFDQPVYTVEEVAKIFSIHPRTAYLMIRNGRIPGGFRVGRAWRVAAKALTAYMERASHGPGPCNLATCERCVPANVDQPVKAKSRRAINQ